MLVRVTSAGGTRSDLGVPRADGRAARGRHRRAQGSCPGPTATIDDATAAQLAEQAKAELALVASVSVGALVPVRGQPQPAALVTARVRMFDKGKPVGQGTANAAARGEDTTGYAVDRALTAAMTDVLPPAPQKLAQAGAFNGDDTPIGEAGVVLVRMPSTTPFWMVLEEQRYLAGAKGVRAASLRRLSPSGWVIGVATDQSIERVARSRRSRPQRIRPPAVKIVGDVVEVTLSGAP